MGDRWPERPGGRERDETTSWKVVANPRAGTSERVWQSQVPVEPAAARRGDPRPVSGYANGAYPGTYRVDPDRTSYHPTYRPADEPASGGYGPVDGYPAGGYPAGGHQETGYGGRGNGHSATGYPGQAGYQDPAFPPPSYGDPAYQEDPAQWGPAYQEPAYQEPAYRDAAYRSTGYQDPAHQVPGYVPSRHPEPSYSERPTGQFDRAGLSEAARPASGPAYPTSPFPAPPTSAPAYRTAGGGEPSRTFDRATGVSRRVTDDDDGRSRRRTTRPRSGLPEPAAAWPPVMAWTVGCFVVPLLLFLGWAWTRSGEVPATCLDLGEPCSAPRAAALTTFVDMLPGVAAAVALSLLAAMGLRRLSETWRPVTVGLGGAIIGAGFATLLTSIFS